MSVNFFVKWRLEEYIAYQLGEYAPKSKDSNIQRGYRTEEEKYG